MTVQSNQIRTFLPLGLLFLSGLAALSSCSPKEPVASAPGQAAPASDMPTTNEDHLDSEVSATEAVIDGILPTNLRAMARSVSNKLLPSKEQVSLFSDVVEFSGITAAGAPSSLDSVQVTIRHWHVEEQTRQVPREELVIWDAFFEDMEYFKNAKFKVVRGEFSDEAQHVLETTVKFAALARAKDDFQYAKALLEIQWVEDDFVAENALEGAGPAWRVKSWKTLHFDTYAVEDLLFTDVFGETVPESLYRSVAERTREVELRAATIVANLDAHRTFKELAVAMDDTLIPYTRSEIEAILPGLNQKEKDYVRLRYGQLLSTTSRLCELLDLEEEALFELQKGVDVQLGAQRRLQRPEVIQRLRSNDAFRRKVAAGVEKQGSFNSAALSVMDIDGDGFDDIFVSRNEHNFLLRNLGDGTFEEYGAQVDLPQSGRPINAALFLDTDNDGDLDLIYGFKNGLGYFINENGRYVDRTDELLETYQPRGNVAMSAADYNGDGLIDIYVQTRDIFQPASELIARKKLNYDDGKLYGAWLPETQAKRFYARAMEDRVHSTFDRPGPPNMLLRNMGGGKLALAPDGDQVELYTSTHFAAWSDYDADGDPDLYVANDFGPNNFFRNDGGTLVDITEETGTADIGFGMGVSWGDYDNDGDQDLYVTNMYSKAGLRITQQSGLADTRANLAAHGNTLFQNNGNSFERVSGEEKPLLTVEPGGWGWGSQFLDINNDGYLDIYAPSGYVSTPAGFEAIQDT